MSQYTRWPLTGGGSVTPGDIDPLALGSLIVGNSGSVGQALAVGTDGFVLTANSAAPLGVEWAALPTGGANTALSNLASTAINADLIPGADGAIDLGDATHNYAQAYLFTVNTNEIKDVNVGDGIVISTVPATSTDQSGPILIDTGDGENGNTGDARVASGDIVPGAGANSGTVTIKSGDNNGGTDGLSGDIILASGIVLGAGDSGAVNLNSGGSVDGTSGQVLIGSGASDNFNSGAVTISTGNGANTGSITARTGTASGSRGNFTFDVNEIQAGGSQITNLSDPTSDSAAATKIYVDEKTSVVNQAPLRSCFYDDMYTNAHWTIGSGGFAVSSSGATTNSPGEMACSNTTVVASVGYLAGYFKMTGGVMTYETRIRFSNLSDGTNTFTGRIGAGETFGAGAWGAGFFFSYTHSVNSGNFTINVAHAAATSSADSGVPVVAGQWYRLKITCNASGSSYEFFIDDTSVGTLATANVPTSGDFLNFIYQLDRTAAAAAASRVLAIDYIATEQTFTTPR